ncbi:hypothetical protein RHOFW104T7_11905 [Rhodanobacter thiooxydans]|uniref:HTH araC/xylS-type domain-containing protein n=1 Tax=Rhodanobacter thiooxydans TaxID=416169 RepID=A0A154QJC8_9GAMM|nr:AraC family transcriptional regulator [Rhodanobacter thiooxydans]EIL98350.1 putative AraC-family transcriptional regulator [Rhodanobacter thiooxydans LCS2]KZC23846.1 hypothetical protein RHOFW104T7_11905 [Rhodanobacter thiooxydans]
MPREQLFAMLTHERTDVISSILGTLGLRAEVYASPTVCGLWQINTTGRHRASFHLISRGNCWLHLRGREPQPVRGGDLIVFPNDAWHVLSSSQEAGGDESYIVPDTPGPTTSLVCGHFDFVYGLDNPVLDILPDCILVPAEMGGSRLGAIVNLLSEEAALDQPGRQVVLDKLADSLFVMTLRYYLAQQRPKEGWLAAAADSGIGMALAAIHNEPHRPWQLADLALKAHLSRAAFAARFNTLLGVPPIAYLTSWRMKLAERMLANQRMSVDAIAEKLGYETSAAFRRAFKRVTGRTPGMVRRRLAPDMSPHVDGG